MMKFSNNYHPVSLKSL